MIRFLADADFNHSIVRGCRRKEPAMDFLSANEANLEGVPDPDVLARAAEQERILVTHDRQTIPRHFGAFLVSGRSSPGVFLVSQYDCLASECISKVLDLESTAGQARSPGRVSEDSCADPTHEPRKSRLGCTAYSRELLKLGIDVGETSVSKYLVRSRKPPSQTWRTLLENHLQSLVSVDFFTVPTIRFQILYVFLVLAHERRRIVHFAVTAHPTAEWTANQLREAFPWESAPRYLLRDRDRIFGYDFVEQVKAMGIEQVLSTPRSPWQRAHIERLIGSIRRECLDHLIVFNERSLRCHLQGYADYYHRTRTHLALQKDCPEPRDVQRSKVGPILSIPAVGGLHHRYVRVPA